MNTSIELFGGTGLRIDRKVLCAAASTVLLMACTFSHNPVSAKNSNGSPCNTSSEIAASASVSSVESTEAGFKLLTESAMAMRLEQVSRISSPCLDSFDRYGMGTLMMTDTGAVVIKRQKIFPSDGANGEGYFAAQKVVESIAGLPDYPGQFVGAIEIAPGLRQPSDSGFSHLGVWRGSSQYVVVAVRLKSTTSKGEAVPLLKSRSKLAGLTYFPSPDGRGGSIGILAKDEHEAYVASIRWTELESR